MINLKPCPFCGHQVYEMDLDDALHPSAFKWYRVEGDPCFYYHNPRWDNYIRPDEKIVEEGDVWEMNCLEIAGGCGANVQGHGEEGAIEAWNRRPSFEHDVNPERLDHEDMPDEIYAYHTISGSGTWIDFDDSSSNDKATKYVKVKS